MTPRDAEGFEQRARDAEAMALYHAERGDYKGDTTWICPPWGQLVPAAPLLLVGLIAVTLLFSLATNWIIPSSYQRAPRLGIVLRSEWRTLYRDLSGAVRDPTRVLVEFLRPWLKPSDEVYVNLRKLPFDF